MATSCWDSGKRKRNWEGPPTPSWSSRQTKKKKGKGVGVHICSRFLSRYARQIAFVSRGSGWRGAIPSSRLDRPTGPVRLQVPEDCVGSAAWAESEGSLWLPRIHPAMVSASPSVLATDWHALGIPPPMPPWCMLCFTGQVWSLEFDFPFSHLDWLIENLTWNVVEPELRFFHCCHFICNIDLRS